MQAIQTLRQHLARFGQEHLLQWWPELNEAQRRQLQQQIEAIDFARIKALADGLDAAPPPELDPARIEPMPVIRLPRTADDQARWQAAIQRGEQALRRGAVGAVLVAGGQGTRLGFNGPKGTFPIGPVSGQSLFEFHCRKIRAISERYGPPVPYYIMTSPANHDATVMFFKENRFFGLERQAVRFFCQGTMPAVDRATGKVLLADRGTIFTSPDGHGGLLDALAAPSHPGDVSPLDDMRARRIELLFYHQVDNPMVKMCDPAFLGFHLQAAARVSSKVVPKLGPDEPLGNMVLVDGQPRVIEYSDLPRRLGELRNPDGSLRIWAGSIAIHVFDVGFFEDLRRRKVELPFHRALKKIPAIDASGRPMTPAEPNGIKFERFIFDVLRHVEGRTIAVETSHAAEFEPVKNATGPNSPESARRQMSNQFAEWLRIAGASVPRNPDGSAAVMLEISPVFALDAEELQRQLTDTRPVTRPTLWTDDGQRLEPGRRD